MPTAITLLPELLIGVGRWESNDPWLGIPAEWDEISGARVIVEAGFRDFRVTPSQGSHFFQNLTAFQIGYFTVNPDAGQGSVDWDWPTEQPSVDEDGCVRHLRFDSPMRVIMNSRTSQALSSSPSGKTRSTDSSAVVAADLDNCPKLLVVGTKAEQPLRHRYPARRGKCLAGTACSPRSASYW
jgi:hypothetical protein